jgi:hypothetical protein
MNISIFLLHLIKVFNGFNEYLFSCQIEKKRVKMCTPTEHTYFSSAFCLDIHLFQIYRSTFLK